MKTIKDHFKKIEKPKKKDVFVEALKRKISQTNETPIKITKTVEHGDLDGDTETIALLKQSLEKLKGENISVIEAVERLTNKVADLQKENETLTYKYSNLKIKYMNVLQNVYASHVKLMKGETLQPKTQSSGGPPLNELVRNFSYETNSGRFNNNIFDQQQIDRVDSNIEIPVDDMHKLSNIPILPRCDATFIREAMKILYKDNLENLNHRTLTGHNNKQHQHNDDGKKPITPSKRLKIISLFESRLGNKSISPSDRIGRFNKVNKLISNGINYIQLKELRKNETNLFVL